MNLKDLSPYINKPELIQETADQIIKDFEMFDMAIKFSGNAYNAYQELYDQMEPNINELIHGNQQKFLSILYRIDVSEHQIKKAVEDNYTEPFSHIVTDLIIKRELQKVVIRHHYKPK